MLDAAVRAHLAAAVRAQLDSIRGCTAELIGSLANSTADRYSDMEILWEVPDAFFSDALGYLSDILSEVHAVEGIRMDARFQSSLQRRVVFVQFAEQPLFWRLELQVFAESVGRNAGFDMDNPEAGGEDWLPGHTALTDGVAALKELLRGNEPAASEILGRAYARMGLSHPAGMPARQALDNLIDHISGIDPMHWFFGDRVRKLSQEFLPLEPQP